MAPIYEDIQLTKLENKISKLFGKKTPKNAIKTRPGANGMAFPYVDFGYVLKELDSNFGIFWEFKVTDKQVGEKYVWVMGELTIKGPAGFSISRPGTGGSRIKVSKTTGEPIDISNDIKAATTLAIRKAASLYGIGADVAYKEIGMYEASPDIQDEEQSADKYIKVQLIKKYFATASPMGFNSEKAKELIKVFYNLDHMEDLTVNQLEKAIMAMEVKYQIVEPGDDPLKVKEFRKKPDDGIAAEGEVIENEETVEKLPI